MAFLSADQRDLYLPLMEGLHEAPPLTGFMRNLLARTHARRACLMLRLTHLRPGAYPYLFHAAAARAAHEPLLDVARLAELGLPPHGPLRSGRVYALDELLDYDNPDRLAQQRQALAEMRINHVRFMRVAVRGDSDAWLLLVREHEDFTAADSALLSTLAPHLTAALRILAAMGDLRLQAAMAQAALAGLGVGELAFDASARVLAADPQAERALSFLGEPGTAAGRRLQLLPETARALDAACADLAQAPPETRRLIRIDERHPLDLLLRPAQLSLALPGPQPVAIGLIRKVARTYAPQAPRIIATAYGLSPREAALAHGLTMGETIVEAGARLGLTAETARNYSKRIYAKTGTTGQPDLVRLLLTGLMPFC
jgi:DNA-binding CsgD family transcriptional regulator